MKSPLFILLAACGIVFAAPPGDPRIPEPLRAWEGWALWGQEHRNCPTPYNAPDKHLCIWPSRLALDVGADGAQFDFSISVFSESWVPLPGSGDQWPENVKSGAVPVPVVEHDGRPSVKLPPGTHRITGGFSWEKIPQKLALPESVGMIALTLEGKTVEIPVWDASGHLWLERNSSSGEADKDFLSVKLYAALEDGIPLWLRGEVEVIVAGKSREEVLGGVLPGGWKLASLESPLPVAIAEDGRMKAQVRPGKWTVRFSAFRLDNPKEFHFAPGVKPAATDELVAFRSRPDFRMVEISGSPSVDISQTAFPEQWRDLPVYRWDTATPFRIEERMRGMGLQKPAGLQIAREWWLDENGKGFTFRDHLTGKMQEIWRLDAAAGQDLGSVRDNGNGHLITRSPLNGAPGVEIRSRDLNLEANGRMERSNRISATGWRTDADNLRVTLNLSPGWRLFALFGADWVRGDWLTAWTLLDLFLLLIFSLGVGKLWGWRTAALAFVAFGLAYHEPGAPRFVWLWLLAPLALLRAVRAGWGRRILLAAKWLVLVLFVLIVAPFATHQIQQAIYPQLESTHEGGFLGTQLFSAGADTADYERESLARTGNEAASAKSADLRQINEILDGLIIPKLDFDNVTVKEAVEFIQQRANACLYADGHETNGKMINIVLGFPPDSPEANARITLSLSEIPLRSALDYVARVANLKLRIEPHAVSLVPQSEATAVLVTKEYRIPPAFMTLPVSQSEVSASAGSSSTISSSSNAQEFLEAMGVVFPPGSSAHYIPSSSTLIIRNTQDGIDLVDALCDAAHATPGDSSADGYMADASSWGVSSAWGVSSGKSNLLYDTKARIQTGPGVPDWTWRTVSFGWNGPVAASQEVRPILVPIGVERLLAVLRVALILGLAALLLRGGRTAAVTAVCLAFLIFLPAANAEIPDRQTLETLRARLMEKSDAYPQAAAIPRTVLRLTGNRMEMDVEIHAAIQTAVPLPGHLPAWSPVGVLLDGKPAASLRRDDGYLWISVPEGIHQVKVSAFLPDVPDWEWTFSLKPHSVVVEAPEWTVNGVSPEGVPDQQVFFTKIQKTTSASGEADYDRQDFSTLAVVGRRIEMGLVWQVRTTVSRLSPGGKAIALRVPLLAGENVLSSNAQIKDGQIEVRLGAQQDDFSWESEMTPAPSLSLSASAPGAWVEVWRLIASPVWNVTISGLAPVFEPGNPDLVPVWHPWPGESVTLGISRPEAIPGATVTVEKSTHEVTPGMRQMTSLLTLNLRCSLGEDFLITLPANAEVSSLALNGAAVPARMDARNLIVPLRPGAQSVCVGWKTNVPLGSRLRVEEVRLPVGSANITTVLNVPDSRWVLWTDGPLRGPAVRFWTVLVGSLLAAGVLGRLGASPLRTGEWMLLGIGLTQVALPAALFVVAWLFFLSWRGSESFLRLPALGFNFLQLILIAATATALAVLIAVVGEGLLGNPEMFIVGNDSTRSTLRWYQARCGEVLPQPGCVSVSIWWFRLLMLAWALWLAASLLRWLRLAWVKFSTGGCFRTGQKKPPAVPPPLD